MKANPNDMKANLKDIRLSLNRLPLYAAELQGSKAGRKRIECPGEMRMTMYWGAVAL
jgi:hypothetical protein